MQQSGSGARVVRTLSDARVSDSVNVVMVDFPRSANSPCVAIKFVALDTERRSLKAMVREYEYLREFRVSHSVGAYGACIVDPKIAPEPWSKLCPSGKTSLAIVMPYIQGQTLREYLRARCVTLAPLIETQKKDSGPYGPGNSNYNGVEERRGREISAVLIPVARFCHELKTRYRHYHGDIKMGNIMISPSGRETFVIDMAYASNLSHRDNTIPWSRGTPCYMAPEKIFFRDAPSGLALGNIAKTDCWSLGVLAITLVLTSRKVVKLDDHMMLDENDHFNPAITDTIFHLLDTSRPWFVSWMTVVGETREYDLIASKRLNQIYAPAIIEQALKLVIFSGSLKEVFGMDQYLLVDSDDFACSKLLSAITTRISLLGGRRLYEDYLANTSHPYEMALITVKSVCQKHCPHVLTVIQRCLRWDTLKRYSFEGVLCELGWHVIPEKEPALVPITERMDEVKGTSLETLLERIADPCATCKTAKARQMCPGTACRARTCSKECHAQHAHVPD